MPAGFAPLSGVRVLDFSQNLAGPYCAQTLADLGADVLKVEPPGGDPARSWGPPFLDGAATIFLSANRGKRGIVLDLKHPDGLAAARRLAANADIVVESFRSGVADRLGIGYDALKRDELIYVSITAYGDEGPLHELSGFDPLMQAHGGLMSVTGWPGRPARVGASVIDVGTGMWAALAVIAALRERDRTGRGRRIVSSLYETALTWTSYHISAWAVSGDVPGPYGTTFSAICPYGSFPTSEDRPVMIAAANDGLFRRLCAALDLDGLVDDVRFRTNPDRVAHRAELEPIIEDATRRRTLDELIGLLRTAGVPCAPIATIDEVAQAPQTVASGILEQAGGLLTTRLPLKWDGVRTSMSRPPAALGEHTRAALREAGYSDAEVDALLASGAAADGTERGRDG